MMLDLDPALGTADQLQVMTILCSLEEGDEITYARLRSVLGLSSEQLEGALAGLAAAGYAYVQEVVHDGVGGRWVGSTIPGRAAFRANVRAIESQLTATRA